MAIRNTGFLIGQATGPNKLSVKQPGGYFVEFRRVPKQERQP